MTDEDRRLELLTIAAKAANIVSTTVSLAQGTSLEEANRIHQRANDVLNRGSDGPIPRFNALCRGLLGSDAHNGCQIETTGVYAERNASAVAEMTRIARHIWSMPEQRQAA